MGGSREPHRFEFAVSSTCSRRYPIVSVHGGSPAASRGLRRTQTGGSRPAHRKAYSVQTETIALNIIWRQSLARLKNLLRLNGHARFLRAFRQGRFRVNVFRATRKLFRRLPPVECDIPTLDQLKFSGDFQGHPQGKNRPGAGHRRHRFRQIHQHSPPFKRNQRSKPVHIVLGRPG